MPGKIYLDVFFVVNSVMDYIALHITASIMKWNTRWKEELLAAIFGGMWAVLYVILIRWMRTFPEPLWIANYVIIPFAMVRIIAGKIQIKRLLRGFFVLYIVTFMLAGIIELGWSYSSIGYGILMSGISTQRILIGVLGMVICWRLGLLLLNLHKKYNGEIYDVVLTIEDVEIKIRGLRDTGNVLVDPYTGKNVHIIEKSMLNSRTNSLWNNKDEIMQKVMCRLIPFQSVGASSGILPVFTAKQMKIRYNKDWIVEQQVAIGVYDGKLSGNESYNMLLNASTFEKVR